MAGIQEERLTVGRSQCPVFSLKQSRQTMFIETEGKAERETHRTGEKVLVTFWDSHRCHLCSSQSMHLFILQWSRQPIGPSPGQKRVHVVPRGRCLNQYIISGQKNVCFQGEWCIAELAGSYLQRWCQARSKASITQMRDPPSPGMALTCIVWFASLQGKCAQKVAGTPIDYNRTRL